MTEPMNVGIEVNACNSSSFMVQSDDGNANALARGRSTGTGGAAENRLVRMEHG